MSPKVVKVESRDIGEWSDDHPLNNRTTADAAYAKLFKDCHMTTNTLALPEQIQRAIHHLNSAVEDIEDGMKLSAKDWIAMAIAALQEQAEPVVSIDTPEFRSLLEAYVQSPENQTCLDAFKALVTHIDANLTAAPQSPSAQSASTAQVTDEQILAEMAKRYYPPKEAGNELLQRIYPHELVAGVRALLSSAPAKEREQALEEAAAKADDLLNGLRSVMRHIPDVGAAIRGLTQEGK